MMNIKAKLLIVGALAVLSLAAVKSASAQDLTVSWPENQPEGRNLASPADNINFLSFSLKVEEGDPALIIKRLVVKNLGSSGQQARSALTSLTLYSQAGNVVARTSTRFGRNGYIFNNINYNLPNDGRSYSFGISATVNNNIEQGSTIKLSLENASDVRAYDAEGNLARVWAQRDPLMIRGNEFTITADGDNGLGRIDAFPINNPLSGNIVAGGANVPVLNIRFTAFRSSFRLSSLRFAQIIEGTTRSVESLTIVYPNEAGEHITITRSFTGNRNYLTFNLANNPVYVSINAMTVVNVYANLAAINQNFGAYTGDNLKFSFIANQGFVARNDNNRLIRSAVAEGNQVAGGIMVVHGTLPTIEAVADNGNLANGSADLYRFRVTAAEGTDLTLKKLSFRLTLNDSVTIPQNATATALMLRNFQILEGSSYNNAAALTQGDRGADSYQIYNGYGVTTSIATGYSRWPQGGKLSNASGTIVAFYSYNGANARDVIAVFNDDRLITSGNSQYYILRANALNVDTGASSNDSISTYMYDGDRGTTTNKVLEGYCDVRGAVYGVAGRNSKYCLTNNQNGQETYAYFIWSDSTGTDGDNRHQDVNADDRYDGAQVNASADWFNGWKIKTLSVQRTLN